MIEKILNFIKEERIKAQKYRSEKLKESDYAKANVAHGQIQTLNKVEAFVQEVAKEYGNASDNDLTVVSALPSLYPLQPFEEEAIHKVVASAKDGGWIPCEVELPPEPKENPVFDNKPLELYLVTLQGTEYPFRAFWTGKEFTDGWGKLRYVTAWQPLPPKYEPKDTPYQKGE